METDGRQFHLVPELALDASAPGWCQILCAHDLYLVPRRLRGCRAQGGRAGGKNRGQEAHPVNDGGICILGLAGLQLLYGPTRIKTPLKRSGERGAGKWTPVTWEAALAEVAEKLGALRSSGKAHTLAAIAGSDRGTTPALLQRFLTAFGSPNFMHTPHDDRYLPAGAQAHSGHRRCSSRFRYRQRRFRAELRRRRHRRLGGAGEHVPGQQPACRGQGQTVPGGTASVQHRSQGEPLASGQTRIRNGAGAGYRQPAHPAGGNYDRSFISQFSANFEAFKSGVATYTLSSVAAATGLPEADIKATADHFAAARRPLAICGRGQGRTTGALAEFAAVHALNALAGNINKKGGFWTLPLETYSQWPEVEQDDIAANHLQKARIDKAGSKEWPDAASLLNNFAAAAAAQDPYGIEALLVAGANPLFSQAGSDTFAKAVAKIPFVVSFSSYMDETASQADIILPNHAYLERYEDVPTPAGFNRPFTGLCQPVVEPQFNTRNTGDVLIQLAQETGEVTAAAFPWESYEACLEETFADSWDTLTEEGFAIEEDFVPPAYASAFATGSGRFEFVLPGAAAMFEVQTKGDFPLVMLPYDAMRIASGYIGNPPFLTKTVPDKVLKGTLLFVEINPETARSIGLSDGDDATLTTPAGSATVGVSLYDGIMPGVIAVPRGLGHTAYDDYLAGKGFNVNRLIDPVADPASGLDAAWGVQAKLTKA
jgi:anaerobic selenocysteine-containing dehydrogenase